MITVTTPYPQFAELDGSPLDNGSVYIGTAGLNSETNPIAVFWDNAGTQPAAQPLTTRSGLIARNGAPSRVYVNAAAYSLLVKDKQGRLIAYEASISSAVGTDNIDNGAITEVKLATAVSDKLNGALQRTGGTMTGALTLAGDASMALQAVPKQQAEAIAETAATSAVEGLSGVNRLINPTFAINQDGFAGGARTAGQYGHDGWKAGASGCTYSVSGETATIATGTLLQIIEGVEVAEGGTYTLSWSGTAQARVDGGAYAASPITVTGKTAGANTTIEFGTGTVIRPQYEAGSRATPFSRRHRVIEQQLCMRHYEIGTHWTMGYAPVSGAVINAGVYFKAPKRIPPTVTIDLSIEASAVSTFSQGQITANGFRTQIEAGAVGIVRASGVFVANARL